MHARQEQTLTMFRNAHEYLAAHPPTAPSGQTAEGFTTQLQALQDLLDRASRHAVDAEAMAQAATPYENVFVEAGRPADFLVQLRGAANALDQSF